MDTTKRRSGSFNPGPILMSKEQMAGYLHNLRTNRPARPHGPAGSRPYLAPSARHSIATDVGSTTSLPRLSMSSSDSDKVTAGNRSSTSLSQRQCPSTRSSLDERRPSEYYERANEDKQQSDLQQSHSTQHKATDIDLEERIFSAAKEQADELVRQYEAPEAPYKAPAEPYAVSNNYETPAVSGILLPAATPRNPETYSTRLDLDAVSEALPQMKKRTSYSKIANYWNNNGLANRRRSSGSKRSLSGKYKGLFANPDDKIYEDPVEPLPVHGIAQSQNQATEPAYLRRNPFARTRSVQKIVAIPSKAINVAQKTQEQASLNDTMPPLRHDGVVTTPPHPSPSKFSTPEIPEEAPEQETVKYKDGMEVRSADLRAATSMRFKDRSAKLPSPTAVSNSPNRPIVSFSPDWTSPKPDESLQSKLPERPRPSVARLSSGQAPEPTKAAPTPVTTITEDTKPPSIQIHHQPAPPIISMPTHPGPDYRVPALPLNTPHIRAFNHLEPACDRTPPISSRNIPKRPIQTPPQIIVQECTPTTTPKHTPPYQPPRETQPPKEPSYRYSPFPKPYQSPPHIAAKPKSPKSPWSASARKTTALCAQCALPISGKIVSAAGLRFHPGCFTCYHCGEGLECVDFYAEPSEKREGRIDRIQRRLNGETIEDSEGVTQAEDGDDSLRFYCHLDFHEFFSPRCKSCKTPIEGEVVVACGAEWHVGHFFCAQCGDPFDPTTPFVEKDGYAWCVECHTNRYSAKCKKCRRPVVNMVVQALGCEWHSECFTCTICNDNFQDGRFFLPAGSQLPVCLACEERRLKA